MTQSEVSSRVLKRRILALLKLPDFEVCLRELRQFPSLNVINSLFSFLYNLNPEIKWKAVTAIGALVAKLADEDMEAARDIMRRLMWNLNDESGGIGWGSPEAMGEIAACHDALAEEYAPILLSYAREDGNFLEYEPMQRGVLWGIGRLCLVRQDLVKDSASHIIPFLHSRDSVVRGIAAWIMSLLGRAEARSSLEGLIEDEFRFKIYMDRRLMERKVKDMAVEALKKLPGGME